LGECKLKAIPGSPGAAAVESVLLVESHGLLRSALKELLAGSGFGTVLEACNPIEALLHIVGRSPRIIVLDTVIPEMEGFYLGQMLRELSPQSKIVVLLENTDAHYLAAVRSSGADAFVAKSKLTLELPLLLNRWQYLFDQGAR
jgi:DNA-binding NarL/FixJ family response regulator